MPIDNNQSLTISIYN